MTERGKAHEIEPDDGEALCYIDFEEMGHGVSRFADMLAGIGSAMTVANVRANDRYVREALLSLLEGNEDDAWTLIGRAIRERGFDTYDSDTRFEVYVLGTKESE